MAQFQSKWRGGRLAWTIVFGVWGGCGLFAMLGQTSLLPTNVGVGTSAYLALQALVWIGGTILFGISALLSSPNYVEQQAPAPAPKALHGFPYEVQPDGAVVAQTREGPVRYPDWKSFFNATKR